MEELNYDTMVGLTEDDNDAIRFHMEMGYPLFIDDQCRVWNESEVYIADAKIVGNGNGIFWTYSND